MAKWVETTVNNIPEGAIRGGYEANGDSLFIARAKTPDGYVSAGKCSRFLPGAHIPYDGKELIFHNYEVLVFPIDADGYYEYQSGTHANVPPNAVMSDTDTDDAKVYVGRFMHANSLVPGKVFTPNKTAYVSYGGKEYPNDVYEVLVKVK